MSKTSKSVIAAGMLSVLAARSRHRDGTAIARDTGTARRTARLRFQRRHLGHAHSAIAAALIGILCVGPAQRNRDCSPNMGWPGTDEEIEADGATGHFEGLTLFLYNPDSHQWTQTYASSRSGSLNSSLTGAFKDGRGELIGLDQHAGRTILVRTVWSDIKPDSHRFEQSFSEDGGKTWEPRCRYVDSCALGARFMHGIPVGDDAKIAIGAQKGRLSRRIDDGCYREFAN